ncbi:MAG TPA: hypothetical protein VHV30_07925 [Polyangiaceae bacterium]|jgi:hypothetical protein|nr:hypothetical protein [Polyangiaceae bacterium]
MQARKTPAAIALVAVIAALAAWRAVCILAGPDVDTDAYAHHMIARAILADPRDLAVHWVWLPLFHYLQVPLVALGGTMNDVRWVNLVLAAASPVVLFLYVRRTARGGPMGPDLLALLAGVFAAACPIAMQMGTTAQSEPLFAILALGIAIAFQERRHGLTAALLAVAVVVRYEGWAIFAAVGGLTLLEALAQRRSGAPARFAWRPWLAVAVPVVPILIWAILRRPVDGRWFGFLGDTHSFVSQAMVEKASARSPIALAGDALYYPAFVALRVLGPVAVLAPFGLVRAWRQQGPRFVLVLAAVLGFISLTWVQRSSLGLDRHFVAVVPLYAACGAQGIAAIAAWAGDRLAASTRREAVRAIAARAVAGALAVAASVVLFVMLDVWMGFWRASIQRGWPERAALGAYLRTLPEDAPIFCDDATLEILSGVDRRRFDRHWIDDPATWTLIDDVARAHGVAYVATWRRKLIGHEGAGDIVFIASDTPKDALEAAPSPTAGVAVLRVGPTRRTGPTAPSVTGDRPDAAGANPAVE